MAPGHCCKACSFTPGATLVRETSILCSSIGVPSWDGCGDAGHVAGEGITVAVGVQGWIEHLCACDIRVCFLNAFNPSPSSSLTRLRFSGRDRGNNVNDCACFEAAIVKISSPGEDGGVGVGVGVGEGVCPKAAMKPTIMNCARRLVDGQMMNADALPSDSHYDRGSTTEPDTPDSNDRDTASQHFAMKKPHASLFRWTYCQNFLSWAGALVQGATTYQTVALIFYCAASLPPRTRNQRKDRTAGDAGYGAQVQIRPEHGIDTGYPARQEPIAIRMWTEADQYWNGNRPFGPGEHASNRNHIPAPAEDHHAKSQSARGDRSQHTATAE
ncbi:hypothetical protein T440DRAFT_484335 [Plenodomus tracheiphilus IPT5]|uniref:Uncharacterized protein n=1 Tax=Plenodomus tracheiphilus IPT5 TaxID=1408161 RepID=A0A6A7AM65_9PLEO|nr:hypothetical protein T440DRAFT_484335 [Plenodomus tracheiphilus IPT5]